MPKLIIDQRPIEVPAGTKVIAAAEQLGIMIPRFCYHPGLGSFGACRMCAVKFLEGPVKGIEMSCMEDARDGMVVSTTDPEAMEFRRYVIEWLMMHHPLDCPVCDEGGHCLLQDETVSGGHGIRRYLGPKRTYQDQYLGAFVQHEMNRCIQCWRCRNFYQEFAGYRDFGAMQIANRMYFGRYEDGPSGEPLFRQYHRHLPHRGAHRQTGPLRRAALGFRAGPVPVPPLLPGLQHHGQRPLPADVAPGRALQ